jgi:hypothetical protein
MNITHKYTRFMAVGCSHGNMIDQSAAEAVLKFKAAFKPKRVFHLGDWCDTAALRSGAKGTADEGKPIGSDIDEGLDFLEKLGVTDCTMGNHDERPWRYLNHHNAMIREMGKQLVSGINERMAKLGITWVNQWNVRKWIEAYGYKWMHGYMYNENVARDHAEAHGNVVFAHAHTTMIQKGRRDDCPTGICVGTLSDIPNMDYAKNRRKTLSWSHGFVWGEGRDNKMAYIYLHENGQQKEWRLPTF